MKIPDISKWNTINTVNMAGMFDNCYKLYHLPNISEWRTDNVRNILNACFVIVYHY